MIIVLKQGVTENQMQHLTDWLQKNTVTRIW